MKRTVYDCDGCPKKDLKTATVSFFSHISSGGPGPSEREYNHLDLCLECVARLAAQLIDKLPDAEQGKLHSGFKPSMVRATEHK